MPITWLPFAVWIALVMWPLIFGVIVGLCFWTICWMAWKSALGSFGIGGAAAGLELAAVPKAGAAAGAPKGLLLLAAPKALGLPAEPNVPAAAGAPNAGAAGAGAANPEAAPPGAEPNPPAPPKDD